MDMLPRSGHVAAKAKSGSHACCQGHGSPHGQAGKAKHAAKAMACLHGHASMPLGARNQGPLEHAAKALACTLPKGQGQHNMGMWARPWPWLVHALALVACLWWTALTLAVACPHI